MVKKQNAFSRSLANEEKLGAYYTDPGMCRRIGFLLSFDSEKEYSVLEPSCGDCVAVNAVCGGRSENIKIFGVELNPNTYKSLSEKDADYILNADFLEGVRMSNGAFSMCFMNPPYGVDEDGCRYEQRFVVKAANYIRAGGLLVAVLPSYVVADEKFATQFLSRYFPLGEWRFDNEVYQQFKQVVLIAKRRPGLSGVGKEALSAFLTAAGDVEKLPYLPTEPVEDPIVVPAGSADRVETFEKKDFDPDEGYELLRVHSPMYGSREVGRKAETPDFGVTELGQPIIPLSPSMCYLIATTGGGAGLCGDENLGTRHLQRGTAKTVTEQHEETGADGNVEIVEATKTKMCLKIVENDGTITSF